MPKYRNVTTDATRIAKSWPGHGWIIVRETEETPAPAPAAPAQAVAKRKRGRPKKVAASLAPTVVQAPEPPVDETPEPVYDDQPVGEPEAEAAQEEAS